MLNVFCFVGLVADEPRYKELPSRFEKEEVYPYCFFSVATKSDVPIYGQKYRTSYFKMCCTYGIAKYAAKYLHKGDVVSGHGRLDILSYVNAQGVKKQYVRCYLYCIQRLYQLDERIKQAKKGIRTDNSFTSPSMMMGGDNTFVEPKVDVPDDTEFYFE